MLKKLYTEEQYQEYSAFMDGIANQVVISENVKIYSTMKGWIRSNNISDEAIDQMDDRMMQEDTGEIPKLQRIKWNTLTILSIYLLGRVKPPNVVIGQAMARLVIQPCLVCCCKRFIKKYRKLEEINNEWEYKSDF